MKRYLPLGIALLLALAAAFLVLLALDARTWHSTVARDDLRFRALRTHAALWEPNVALPGDPAGAILGTGSTVAWRQAMQSFWFSRVGKNPDSRTGAVATLRADAQDRLVDQMRSAPTKAQRSVAANLLGVLVVTTPTPGGDRSAITQILRRASALFQTAIVLDPSDVAAKQNLELVLRIRKPGKSRISRDARAGYGFGRGQGSQETGSGY